MVMRMNEEFHAPILPLARYRLRFRPVAGAGSLDALRGQYLGSAWRGAFGASLRAMVCVTRQPVCDGCPLLLSCPYPVIFESRPPASAEKFTLYPRTPGPYVLQPEELAHDQAANEFYLGLTLFGTANNQLPYIAHAFERAGKSGLTRAKIKLELIDIEAETSSGAASDPSPHRPVTGRTEGWTSIYKPGRELQPAAQNAPEAINVRNSARVRLLSPLRLRRDNRSVPGDELTFKVFMSSLVRRISMLTYFFSPTPLETDFAGLTRLMDQIKISGRDLEWRDLERYSSRQRGKIPMGGLLGEFQLGGADLAPFWPYLWLGQWTHAGRGCTMGLGRYALELED